ncbi:MAG TPA: efflux RND transporter periplasmic adaptor subunit [Verrucomicrobiae bacterium]|jgi:HlyD family secretion protein
MISLQTIQPYWQKAASLEWLPSRIRPWAQKNPRLVAGAATVLLLLLVIALVRSCGGSARSELAYFTVKRGDFVVSITEGGSLRAVKEEIIRSEVEGTTRIISIVPEGTLVKKGELLIDLDSSDIQEKLTQQEILAENQKFAFVQAEQGLSIQKSLAESNIREAELKVQFAGSDLEKYVEADYPADKDVIESKILLTEEDLQRSRERARWTEQLFKKNYASKNELDADNAKVKSTGIDLEQSKRKLMVLTKYDFPKRKALLESNLEQAKDDLMRLKQRSTSQLAQAEADLDARKRTLDLHNQRLQQLKDALGFCKIYAPQDGLVVYPNFSSSSGYVVEEGATVRQRQELIKLPDTSSMLVEVKVHESFVNQIKPSLLAYVTIDSMPERRFVGSVRRVAPLPDTQSRYMNPNLKVYSTEVVIEEPLPDIKPGVSAHAEIVITNLSKVVSVPVQAVTTIKGQQYVYLAGKADPTRVEVGFNNDRFVEIRSGVDEGGRILLSPPLTGDVEDTGAADVSSAEVEAAKAKIKKGKRKDDAKGAVSRGGGKSTLPPPPKPEKSGTPRPEKPPKPSKSGGISGPP